MYILGSGRPLSARNGCGSDRLTFPTTAFRTSSAHKYQGPPITLVPRAASLLATTCNQRGLLRVPHRLELNDRPKARCLRAKTHDGFGSVQARRSPGYNQRRLTCTNPVLPISVEFPYAARKCRSSPPCVVDREFGEEVVGRWRCAPLSEQSSGLSVIPRQSQVGVSYPF